MNKKILDDFIMKLKNYIRRAIPLHRPVFEEMKRNTIRMY